MLTLGSVAKSISAFSLALLGFTPILFASVNYGSTNDLWDVSRGTIVTAASPSDNYFDGRLYAKEFIFGAYDPSFSIDPGVFVFADGESPGQTNFVEWKTIKPMVLNEFRLYASGDGPAVNNQREFASFKLFAKSPSSQSFDIPVYSYIPTHPYTFADAPTALLVDATVSPVTSSEFRAEFTAYGSGLNGARVMELDGFGSYVGGATNRYGATDDIWDVSQGTVVTAVSASNGYWDGRPYPKESIFGYTDPSFPLESGDYIFADNQAPGQVTFVEWQSAHPVLVSAYRLYAAGDGVRFQNQREFASFRLLAKSPGSPTYDVVLDSFTPSHPYSFVDATQLILREQNVTPITAQQFRAEFTAMPNQARNGARIFELDGFSKPLPPRVVARPAVEISWESIANHVYQIQYTTTLELPNWTNFGSAILGNGGSMSVFDSTSSDSSKSYRIVDLSVP